jgi:hypothetical protein
VFFMQQASSSSSSLTTIFCHNLVSHFNLSGLKGEELWAFVFIGNLAHLML